MRPDSDPEQLRGLGGAPGGGASSPTNFCHGGTPSPLDRTVPSSDTCTNTFSAAHRAPPRISRPPPSNRLHDHWKVRFIVRLSNPWGLSNGYKKLNRPINYSPLHRLPLSMRHWKLTLRPPSCVLAFNEALEQLGPRN